MNINVSVECRTISVLPTSHITSCFTGFSVSSLHNAAQAGQVLVLVLDRPLREPLPLHPGLLGVPRLLVLARDDDGVLVELGVLRHIRRRRDRGVQSLQRLHGAVDLDFDLNLRKINYTLAMQ